MTYSTCSMDPEENEFVVQKFLKNNPKASLEQANLNGIILNNKLTQFKTKEIDEEVTQKQLGSGHKITIQMVLCCKNQEIKIGFNYFLFLFSNLIFSINPKPFK